LITFTDLGLFSYLGNELFQYAALLGVAERQGYEVRLPPSSQHSLATLIELDTPTYTTTELRRLRYRFGQCYPAFGYEASLETIPDWCDVFGYFQSRRHFPSIEKLRHAFRIRADVQARVEETWSSLDTDRPVVGFHVRRGDSAGSTHWITLADVGYYPRAMDQFSDLDPLFLVVSDDPEWCEANLRAPNVVVAQRDTPAMHLALLARCDHLILANSTFSWWAAWFQEPRGGRVVGPREWYHPGTFDNAEQDRPATWIEL